MYSGSSSSWIVKLGETLSLFGAINIFIILPPQGLDTGGGEELEGIMKIQRYEGLAWALDLINFLTLTGNVIYI